MIQDAENMAELLARYDALLGQFCRNSYSTSCLDFDAVYAAQVRYDNAWAAIQRFEDQHPEVVAEYRDRANKIVERRIQERSGWRSDERS